MAKKPTTLIRKSDFSQPTGSKELAMLLDLALQFLDALLVYRGRPFTLAIISFVLTHPGEQSLRRATNLGSDRFNR